MASTISDAGNEWVNQKAIWRVESGRYVSPHFATDPITEPKNRVQRLLPRVSCILKGETRSKMIALEQWLCSVIDLLMQA